MNIGKDWAGRKPLVHAPSLKKYGVWIAPLGCEASETPSSLREMLALESTLTTQTELPVALRRAEILRVQKQNRYLGISGETGSGKSTQVPQMMLEYHQLIWVTQPRRLAARTLADRVAEEQGCELGELVGYRTAIDHCYGPQTRILFLTEELALNLMLSGQYPDLLILDEIHEQNSAMHVLMAYCKLQISKGLDLKLLMMSATVDAGQVSKYFDNAPFIEVDGRLYPVTPRAPKKFLFQDIRSLVSEEHNVLVFLAGKKEIQDAMESLNKHKVDAVILPLHGQLSPGEQRKCFRSYDRPKVILATNVAQTSITIPDITAVVDTGMEKRVELSDDKSVEGLYARPISLADSKQRAGRAGRCQPGIYVDRCQSSHRPKFPLPELLRIRLDRFFLRLYAMGIDPEMMEFIVPIPKDQIQESKRLLIALNCLTPELEVTEIGHAVAKLPVAVQNGCMIHRALQLGVAADVLVIASILNVKGILRHKDREGNDITMNWYKHIRDEEESDLLGQLKLFSLAIRNGWYGKRLFDNGIDSRSFYEVKEMTERMAEALSRTHRDLRSSGDREKIMEAVIVGMVDHVYHGSSYGGYTNGDSVKRKLNKFSLVKNAPFLVGLPWDLEITNHLGSMTLNLVHLATRVDPKRLVEIAPQTKEFVQARVNQQAWVSFIYSPESRYHTLPTTSDVLAGNILIEEYEYGECLITGEPLIAYGTPAKHQFAWQTGDFRWAWFKTKSEANMALTELRAYLSPTTEFGQNLQEIYDHVVADIDPDRAKRLEFDKKKRELRLKTFDQAYGLVDVKLRQDVDAILDINTSVAFNEDYSSIKYAEEVMVELDDALEIARGQFVQHQREKQRLAREAATKYDYVIEHLGCDTEEVDELIAFARFIQVKLGMEEAKLKLKEIHGAAYGWKKKKAKLFALVTGLEDDACSDPFKKVRGNEKVKAWLKTSVMWMKREAESSNSGE